MSLLMQALKKAEHAKQKQSGVAADNAPAAKQSTGAPDDALSLSPKEGAAEPLAIPDSASAPEPGDLDSRLSALTLSPQSEDKSAEPDLAYLPIAAPAPENIGQAQAMPSATFDAVKKEEVVESTPRAPKESATQAEAAAKTLTRPGMPKIDAEQKQLAAEAEKTISTAQQKAKSVFSSKTAPRGRRRVWITAVGLTIVVVQAGLGYLYWQSTNTGGNSSLVGAPQAALPAPPLPTAAPDPASKPLEASAAAQVMVADSAPASTLMAPATKAVATAAPAPEEVKKPREQIAAADPTPADSSAPPAKPAATPKAHMAQTTQPADSSAIQIRQSSSGDQINPALHSAYQFFISGDAASARQQYQKVLQQEPSNRDALLGMAAIALNQRQPEQAGSFYGKLLELDPNDPEAIAGLTSLQQGDPVQSESRLKKIINQNPQAGAVLFTLGNLYAQQSRWSDAQQTYFRAYTSAPANADYAFNLAVSLDRLNQPRLAQEYYQRALTLGQSGPGNFSRSGVQKRIRELETPADE